MWKWILAALGVVVLSLAISATHMHLTDRSSRAARDAAVQRDWRIDGQYESVSLISLIATPERYDGHKVRVSGFLTLAHEDLGLHIDKDAYEAGIRKNALWLELPNWPEIRTKLKLHRRYGEVAGIFVAGDNGAYGLYSGALTDIRGVEPTFTDADYQDMLLDGGGGALAQHLLSGWFLTLIGWFALGTFWLLRRAKAAQ